MPTFEITRVEPEPKDWNSDYGLMHVYTVTANGKTYEINRKPTSGPPPLGPVEAEVRPSEGDYPDKLKLTPQGRSGGFSGGGNDPERQRRIERQHSQDMGLAAMHLFSRRYDETEADELRENVKEWTDWFQKDLEADGGGGDGGLTGPTVAGPTAAVSPETTEVDSSNERIGFASEKQKTFWHTLLKRAGLDSTQNESITRYAETLPTDRVSAAMDGLNSDDEETQNSTVAGLLRLSDEWARKQSDVPWDDEQ